MEGNHLATQTRKKLPVKEAPLVIRDDGSGYCSDCQYTWCSLKGTILYCSLKYRGEFSFTCENGKCETY